MWCQQPFFDQARQIFKLMFYKLNALNAKTPLRRIAPASSKSGRADALKECASTRTVILYRQGRNYHVGP